MNHHEVNAVCTMWWYRTMTYVIIMFTLVHCHYTTLCATRLVVTQETQGDPFLLYYRQHVGMNLCLFLCWCFMRQKKPSCLCNRYNSTCKVMGGSCWYNSSLLHSPTTITNCSALHGYLNSVVLLCCSLHKAHSIHTWILLEALS